VQTSIAGDPQALAAKIAGFKRGLVVLEGCTGAGKTYLAETLGELISGSSAVHADQFIAHRDVGYSVGMNLQTLRQAICQELRKSPIVIFEGVLARDLLEKIGHQGKLFVYVQLNSTVGVPADLDTLDQEGDRPEPFGDEGTLAAEVAEYHRRRRPRANADIVFIRVAD